jgi:hypothetical protein
VIDDAWKKKVEDDIADLRSEQDETRKKVDEVINQNVSQDGKLDRMLGWQSNATKAMWIILAPILGGVGIGLIILVARFARP